MTEFRRGDIVRNIYAGKQEGKTNECGAAVL